MVAQTYRKPVIFGDNQFFGINHMSEEKAQAQAERFKDIGAIIKVIDPCLHVQYP